MHRYGSRTALYSGCCREHGSPGSGAERLYNIYRDVIKNEIKEEWKLPEELVEQLAKSCIEQRESILFNYVLSALWRI